MFTSMINLLFDINPFLIMNNVTLKTPHSLLAMVGLAPVCNSMATESGLSKETAKSTTTIREEKDTKRASSNEIVGFSCSCEVA